MTKKDSDRNLIKGIIAGTIGGLVASFVMTKYQAATAALSDDDGGGKKSEPATVKAAKAVSKKVLDHKLTKSEKEPAGEAMHYLMGGISGAIYGATAEMTDSATIGAGFPFGTAVWAIADDIVVPALGLSKPATEFSLSTHAYALSSHWVYGLTSEMVRRAVRKVL